MPKKRRRIRRSQGISSDQKDQSDFTLASSADAKEIGSRLRKSTKSKFGNVVKEAEVIEDAFEEQLDTHSAISPDNNNTPAIQMNDDGSSEYKIYPLIFWILISEHIRPEDVQRFSMICKSCYYVTNTTAFWLKLYKRYYRKVDNANSMSVPKVDEPKGLKASVVRALFLMYKPFSLRTEGSQASSTFLDSLLGRVCIFFKFEKDVEKDGKFVWVYRFKLKKNYYFNTVLENSKLYENLDINFNPEKDCVMLSVYSSYFIYLPCLNGSVVKMITSSAIGHYKFIFTSQPNSKKSTSGDLTVTFKSNTRLKIYHWWHDNYYQSKKQVPEWDFWY